MLLPIKINACERELDKFSNCVGFAGCNDEVIGVIKQCNAQHRVDIVGSVAPIDCGIQVAEYELIEAST